MQAICMSSIKASMIRSFGILRKKAPLTQNHIAGSTSKIT